MFWFSLIALLSALSISNPLENDMQVWHRSEDVYVRTCLDLAFSDQFGETRCGSPLDQETSRASELGKPWHELLQMQRR